LQLPLQRCNFNRQNTIAMRNYIGLLSLNERIDAPVEHDAEATRAVIAELLQKAELGQVNFDGWHVDHSHDFDNQEDSDEPIGGTETHFEIRLAVNEDDIEFQDDGSSFYNYVIDALSFRPSVITNDYEREQGALTKTVIEIRVGELNTDMV